MPVIMISAYGDARRAATELSAVGGMSGYREAQPVSGSAGIHPSLAYTPALLDGLFDPCGRCTSLAKPASLPALQFLQMCAGRV
jgi:hypothetical protein